MGLDEEEDEGEDEGEGGEEEEEQCRCKRFPISQADQSTILLIFLVCFLAAQVPPGVSPEQ